MTPIASTDNSPSVASVRRSNPANEVVRNDTSRGNNPSRSDPPARPSTVVNLNSSANQAVLNGFTYANPRTNGTPRGDATAQLQAQDAQQQTLDRQALQAAEATNNQRQAQAAGRNA